MEPAKTIIAMLPAETNVTALVPIITVSPKATINPASGIPQDFTHAKTYIVTAEDGTQAVYTVTVTHDNGGGNEDQPCTISVMANPAEGGIVSGGGSFQQGQFCTVLAIANEGYVFNNWLENDNLISTDSSYTFEVTSNRSLVAQFVVDSVNNTSGYNIGSGIFVLNEGSFQYSNASLSFYDPDADTVVNNLFYKVNSIPLGDVAASLALSENDLFVVLNNSKYIYKVNATTIEYEARLDNFYSPREIQIVSPDKAYVSDLMSTGVWIINPMNMSHCGFIETGKTTEKMAQVGNELYVSNWSNYYTDPSSHDSYTTVQVIDLNRDMKVAEIEVGKEPNTMAVDKNGHVWVLCEGRSWDDEYGENPTLWEINPILKTATLRFEFNGYNDNIKGTASALKANPDGDQLYMIYNNEVRRFDIYSLSLSETFRITPGSKGLFYNMAVDPNTGDLYVADVKNYMMNGVVYRYSFDGILLNSFEVGMIPSALLFK